MLRRWKRVVGFLTMTALLAVGGFYALNAALDPFNDKRFSAEAWSSADSQGRGPMARDAIRHLPAGTTKDRVRELLGDGRPPFRDPRGLVDGFGVALNQQETWIYYLGSWSGIGPYAFDSAFLYVHFGPDDRVIAVEINGG